MFGGSKGNRRSGERSEQTSVMSMAIDFNESVIGAKKVLF